MKITTNNSLTKLIQLIKAKLDELSQMVMNSFNTVDGQISTINTTLSSKPSIDDVTPSATAVYSSQKIQELIADKDFAYEKLTIQASEWTQNGSSNEWKYIHKVEGLSTDKCLFAVVSNGKPLGESDYDLITYTNVSTSASGHTFALTTIGQPTNEVRVCVLYFEIDKSYAQDMTDMYYMYGTLIQEPIDPSTLINDDLSSDDKVYSSSKIVDLLSAKADATTVTNLTNTVNTKADQTAVDTLSASINAKPNINDDAASSTSVYSSSKVEELVASSSEPSAYLTFYTNFDGWQDESGFKTQSIQIAEDDVTNMVCIIDVRLTDNETENKKVLDKYSKIRKAELVYSGTSTSIKFTAETDIGQAQLFLKVLLMEATDGISTYAPEGPSGIMRDSGKCFLTNRAPVSSGTSSGSTVYEFTAPVVLSSFTANSDENIPYYADITDLSSYITDTNKVAVVNPDTSETNSTLLRYTEVVDGGAIRCYFAEQPTSYAIKSIEIRNANLVSVQTTALISFTIDGTSYQAEEGMTWAEWTDSSYDTGNFYIMGTNVCQKPGADVYAVVGAVSTSAITANYSYFTEPWR